jgi:hypothetical protein
MFPRTKILFPIFDFLASEYAFLKMASLFGMIIVQIIEMQVSALSKKLILPAVKTSEFGDESIMDESQDFASLL